MTKTATDSYAWRCQECGHTFRSVAAAERASLGARGCPKCGGVDIDMSLPMTKQYLDEAVQS